MSDDKDSTDMITRHDFRRTSHDRGSQFQLIAHVSTHVSRHDFKKINLKQRALNTIINILLSSHKAETN